ncbi:MAG: hypothetical protein ACYDH1_01620 [Anaerolineaceae bacterium]
MKANYKKMYGITLKEAKEQAKRSNGHLPRPGWETVIRQGIIPPNRQYKLYLANEAGSFFLWQWTAAY